MKSICKIDYCTGCAACVYVCQHNCIEMIEDFEGFLYPKINEDNSVNCKLCIGVCPVLNALNKRVPVNVLAAKNIDLDKRTNSTSGGLFTLLAENTISKNGVVFGAKFDEKWDVCLESADTNEGITPFRGSKYVQSRVGLNYIKVRDLLKKGRKVLFSGTLCQVAGLNHFLGKKYENLISIDFICHGVPSSKVWKLYLYDLVADSELMTKVEFVNFRNKDNGWKNYSFKVVFNYSTNCEKDNKTIFEPVGSNIL